MVLEVYEMVVRSKPLNLIRSNSDTWIIPSGVTWLEGLTQEPT